MIDTSAVRGGGSWRGTRFRVRVLARSGAKGRVKILIQIERIENVELLDCRPVPEKVGEPFFSFWREVH